ncbi:hypothetical protein EON65_31570 [archaeon]|nr:MAG: hypothetical protein EON65_31570 [archaeon]
MKLSASTGNPVFTRLVGTTSNEYGNHMAMDSGGNFYLVGTSLTSLAIAMGMQLVTHLQARWSGLAAILPMVPQQTRPLELRQTTKATFTL